MAALRHLLNRRLLGRAATAPPPPPRSFSTTTGVPQHHHSRLGSSHLAGIIKNDANLRQRILAFVDPANVPHDSVWLDLRYFCRLSAAAAAVLLYFGFKGPPGSVAPYLPPSSKSHCKEM